MEVYFGVASTPSGPVGTAAARSAAATGVGRARRVHGTRYAR
jgi:hypothetical protein